MATTDRGQRAGLWARSGGRPVCCFPACHFRPCALHEFPSKQRPRCCRPRVCQELGGASLPRTRPAVSPRLKRNESSSSVQNYFHLDSLQKKLKDLEEENVVLRSEVMCAPRSGPLRCRPSARAQGRRSGRSRRPGAGLVCVLGLPFPSARAPRLGQSRG